MSESVKLRCLNKKCKRKRRILRDNFMPKGTATIETLCPDCIPTGTRNFGERYFDINDREIK